MSALDPSDCSIGSGCFRARPSDDQEDPCLLSERGKPGRNAEENSAEIVTRV